MSAGRRQVVVVEALQSRHVRLAERLQDNGGPRLPRVLRGRCKNYGLTWVNLYHIYLVNTKYILKIST